MPVSNTALMSNMSITGSARSARNLPQPTDQVSQQPAPEDLQRRVFNLIDEIKSTGIQRSFDLPQLVVCGDQSSGKSSVLSSITRLNFPTKDTLCTKFVTELVMRKAEAGLQNSLHIRIQPSERRDDVERRQLEAWRPSHSDLERFPDIIAQAGAIIATANADSEFGEDVLRVELKGAELQNLDLVDLPGIFHGAGPGQKRSDVAKVQEMVVRYMSRKRTVVLAILSAKDDLAGQLVTSLVAKCNAGDRTLAIITKPDTLDDEPNKQAMYIKAMGNQLPELSFGLGWHVLRNKKHSEQGNSWDQRDTVEAAFFVSSEWADIPSDQKGIGALVARLQAVQEAWIFASADAIHKELISAIQDSEIDLDELRPQAVAVIDLDSISHSCHELVSKAVNGRYTHAFFKIDLDHRLAHVIEMILAQFAQSMQTRGHKWEIVDHGDAPEAGSGTRQTTTVSRDEFLQKLSDRLATAGAMAGQFSPEIFDELFYEQAEQWPALASDVARQMFDTIRRFLVAVVVHVCGDAASGEKLFVLAVEPRLREKEVEFEDYVEHKLRAFTLRWEITLDSTIKDQIIPATFCEEWGRRVLARVPDLIDVFRTPGLVTLSHTREDSQTQLSERVVKTLTEGVAIDTFNAAVMLASLKHYYSTQLRKVVGHFDMENVRENLLSKLPSIFAPAAMKNLNLDLSDLVAEDPQLVSRRLVLTGRLNRLRTLSHEMELVISRDADRGNGTRKRQLHSIDGLPNDIAGPSKRKRGC